VNAGRQDSEPPRASPEGSTPSQRRERIATAFKTIVPFIAGVLTGLILRIVFSGEPDHAFAAMLASFIYGAPILVGMVTVYVAESIKRRTWGYYLAAGFIANVLFVLGTLVVLIEGLICIVVIAPLFGLLGMVGGLIMGALFRLLSKPERPLYGFAVLPLVLGAIEPPPSAERIGTVERSVLINAAPERVWQTIQNADAIEAHEVDSAWMYRIGVPVPLAGVTRREGGEIVRRITMGKSVHFDQVVTEWQENRLMRVKYRYQPDSFPPYALDQHVVLGGHYFDVTGTAYVLEPLDLNTKLTIQMQYRVRTRFNWYAEPVARMLFVDFEHVILEFYRRRSEM
jgi:uncharacterized protein YndB with AHSA1/START domain